MRTPLLYSITVGLLGIFAGGCITILFIVVPFWYSLPPVGLMDWFTAFGPRVGITMMPMEIFPLVLSFVCLFHSRKTGSATRDWAIVCISNVLMILSFFIYFLPVNLSFVNHTIVAEDVSKELATWEIIHTVRTVLSILSAGWAVKIIARS